MANEQMTKTGERPPFDIKERTLAFGVRVVKVAQRLPKTIAGRELGKQTMRSGTSIGANVEEADGATSKKDFIHKMGIARKEARETRYWLRIIGSTLMNDQEIESLTNERDELAKILSKIIQTARAR
jgi:four helix bundle protein